MPYKIVQTIERGEALLSIVPSAWEQEGTLYWPRSKNVSQLVKRENSWPESDWTPINCIRKRHGIKTFEDAIMQLKIMEENSDTDGDVVAKIENCTQQKQSRVGICHLDQNFNDFISQPSSSRYLPANELVVNPLQSASSCDSHSFESIDVSPFEKPTVRTNSASSQYLPVNEPLQPLPVESQEIDVSSLLKDISDNLSTISENFKKVMQEFAYQRTYNDVLMERINALQNEYNKNKEEKRKTDDSLCSKVLEVPIFNQCGMDEVESRLADKEEANDLIKRMKTICGSSGSADGINCAYRLIDHFFKRDFLTNFSWGGGSRTDEKKLSMRNYANILNTFNCIVRLAAHDFDDNKSKVFFQTVLRNAKSRCQTTDRLQRTSTKKNFTNKPKNSTMNLEAVDNSNIEA